MNYLAHAYLSFNHPQVLVGNMISDFVKGKKLYDYPGMVQKGIILHRSIDAFTDLSASTKKLKAFFRADYRLYSGAFSDIVYDHFLALDVNEFASDTVLREFGDNVYNVLNEHMDILPERFRKMLPYMKEHNWLYNYRFAEGIKNSFQGLVRRAEYLTESTAAFEIFNLHYDDLRLCYEEFFPTLKTFTRYQFDQLINI